MDNQSEEQKELFEKLSNLEKRHEEIREEIRGLRDKIDELQIGKTASEKGEQKNIETFTGKSEPPPIPKIRREPTPKKLRRPAWMKSGLEAFIGGNLANIIGILITIIGITIGAKYVIDRNLISPASRIILGYASGVVLLAFALSLKRNYRNFSAVLLSGAMAVFYVITFLAYDLYHLLSQGLSFGLMVAFTVATVIAALAYNRQVIAHIGMVGAYAIPFLVGDDPGSITVLFGYMAILNTGILVIAVGRTWKPLFYNAFVITWGIFIWWYTNAYFDPEHFTLTITFLSIFFILFYFTFISYKLLNLEQYRIDDILVLLVNAFVFFGLGYSALTIHPSGNDWLGLFSIINALIHFAVGLIIYFQKLADKGIIFLITGLGVLFITIAIPVQLNGNWVTLLWTGEAALLFWIGRTRSLKWYTIIAYPLMMLAFYSIIDDWSNVNANIISETIEGDIIPLQNIHFLSSMIFTATFAFIWRINNRTSPIQDGLRFLEIQKLGTYAIGIVLLTGAFFTFQNEISMYFNQLFVNSRVTTDTIGDELLIQDHDLIDYKTIWSIIYTMGFMIVISVFNMQYQRSVPFGLLIFLLTATTIIAFLTGGYYSLDQLTDSYKDQSLAEYYYRGHFHITIRYIALTAVGLTLAVHHFHQKKMLPDHVFEVLCDLVTHITILWILSSEFIFLMDMNDIEGHKYGLSILWGAYSLLLITIGILKRKKHLRIMAIILFGCTLLKVFLYDITGLETLPKTIVMISLGVLLLIISFLYNKHKDTLFPGTHHD